MPASYTLDRQRTLFDDRRLIADAGLLLPTTLAQRLGLAELLDTHVDLGAAAGRAHVGAKALTLVMSALVGGDCIDDADALRAGATAAVLGHRVAAPSTLGTFLRSFSYPDAFAGSGVPVVTSLTDLARLVACACRSPLAARR